MLAIAAGTDAGRDVRPGRRARAPVRGPELRPRSSPGTSTGTSTRRTASRFLAEARRVAAELVVVDASQRALAASTDEMQERILNDGSRWTVYKRYFEPDELADELGGGETLFAGQLVRRRPRVTRRRSQLPLDRIAAARQPRLPRVRRGRLPARVAADRPAVHAASARTCSDRRPGSRRAWSGCRGAAAPARRCGAGSTWTRTTFYATFYCASVTRCYPGARRRGRGDRTPTPREQELCAFWREWELELMRPRLIVTVGGLAARRLLGVEERHRVRRRPLRARRRGRDPAAAPVRRVGLAERSREPRARRRRGARDRGGASRSDSV